MDIEQRNINSISITYKELLREAGRQLNYRKKIIFSRIFLLAWPVMVMMILLFVWRELIQRKILFENSPYLIPSLIFLGVWLVFTLFYYAIFSSIFAIEKRIWIVSYFDQKNLESKDSWRIAKRLLWPAIGIVGQIIIRFYLLPFVIYLFALVVFMYYFGVISNIPISPVLSIIIISGGLLALIIYFYFLKIKLRFIWFIFLDSYGKERFSYKMIFKEMKKMNEISENEIFKKTLLVNIGADSLEAITEMMIRELQKGFSVFGKPGQLFGALFRSYSEVGTKQVISLGQIAAIYVLYRYAKLMLYNQPQEINENIYKL